MRNIFYTPPPFVDRFDGRIVPVFKRLGVACLILFCAFLGAVSAFAEGVPAGKFSFPRGSCVLAAGTADAVYAELAACKYCGRTAANARALANLGACQNSPSKKHVALRGPATRQYYVCRWCGFRARSLTLLTAGACSSNPDGRRHVATN